MPKNQDPEPEDHEAAEPDAKQPGEEPAAQRPSVTVDFDAFLAAEDAESEDGVDKVLVIPEFKMDASGRCHLAEDQTGEVVVRVVPFLGAAALDAITQAHIGLHSARVLETLIHPEDVLRFRARIRDTARPVPTTWLAQATKGVLLTHGIGSSVEPGKGSS